MQIFRTLFAGQVICSAVSAASSASSCRFDEVVQFTLIRGSVTAASVLHLYHISNVFVLYLYCICDVFVLYLQGGPGLIRGL